MRAPVGMDPDVAILAVKNPSVAVQLMRVARECVAQGLSVEFLMTTLHHPEAEPAAEYAIHGLPTRRLPDRTWKGPLGGYPSAPALVQLLRSVRLGFENYKPRVVLTHTDTGGVCRVLQAWAKEKGIPGVAMQEGVSARRLPGSLPGPRGRVRRMLSWRVLRVGPAWLTARLGSYEFADHVLAWGEPMRADLVRRGRPEDSVHVVGSPAFDQLSARAPLAPQGLRTVLFAQQPQPNTSTEMDACRRIIEACASELRCRLLVRPHPRGSLSRRAIEAFAGRTSHPELVETVDTGCLENHLHRASVMLTYYSASAYHGAAHGLPLVLADWVSEMFRLDAPAFGAAISVTSPNDLAAGLRRVLDDTSERRALYDGGGRWLEAHVGPLDGGAARRAAEVIGRIAQASSRDSLGETRGSARAAKSSSAEKV